MTPSELWMKGLLPALLLLALPRGGAAQCPVGPDSGYPVAVEGPLDRAGLGEAAWAVAYRWAPPSRGRAAHRDWRQVTERALPPEPRWPDDWRPGEAHRAVASLTLYGDGREPRITLVSPSGDRTFDASLRSIADDPLPGAPPLPGTADSLTLRLHFGVVPDAPAAVVRFAAQQSPVRVVPGTLMVTPPRLSRRPMRALVKYDVDERGQMVPGSFQSLGGDGALLTAIRQGLPRARFVPAESNCRPVRHTVLQQFRQ